MLIKIAKKKYEWNYNRQKDINYETFWYYFKYQNPSLSANELIRATQARNEQLVNNVNDRLIDAETLLIEKKLLKWKSKQNSPYYWKNAQL